MAVQYGYVIRRTVANKADLKTGALQLARGQWGLATVDKVIVVRDLAGNFQEYPATDYVSNYVTDNVLVKDPVPTAANLPLTADTGELRFVEDEENYYFYTGFSWQSMALDDQIVNNLQFDLTPSGTSVTQGDVRWNPEDSTLDIRLSPNVVLQTGQETLVLGLNKTGSLISNGQVVYLKGAQGQRIEIALADADSYYGSQATIGIVTEDIANNGQGFVTVMGLCRGINTHGLVDGQSVFLSQTAGAFTTTIPPKGIRAVHVGIVVNGGSTGAGSIYVTVKDTQFMNEIRDVDTTGIATGDILQLKSDGLYKPYKLQQMLDDTKDPTGWVNPAGITVTYSQLNRTITLTGDLRYYWRGNLTTLTSPWTSSAHGATTDLAYMLSSADGVNFTWSNTMWAFSDIQVAYINYGSAYKFALREVHGLMPWGAHEELHQTIGTYRTGGGTLTAGTYAVGGTPTDAANTPGMDATTVKDEDLSSALATLTQGSYTRCWGNSSNVVQFALAQSSMVPIGATYIRYNNAGNLTDLTTGKYMHLYVIGVPTTDDADSKEYRYLWVPGSAVYDSLGEAQGAAISANVGNLSTLSPEYVILLKVVLGTSASYSSTGKFRIESVEQVNTTKVAQSIGGTGSSDHNTLSNRDLGIQHQGTSVGNTPAGNISSTSVQAAINELDSEKVQANAAITGATKTKITYDSKGLVTAGADATQDDIPSGTTYGRLTNTIISDLTDGGDSVLHYHASDRARANHTGTQAASTISDFSTAVPAVTVTGFATGANTTITNTDSIETALEKAQGQINARLTGNQTITLSGDASGSGATSISVTNNAINVTEHATNNINYPLVWENTSRTLFKTAAKFTANPATGQMNAVRLYASDYLELGKSSELRSVYHTGNMAFNTGAIWADWATVSSTKVNLGNIGTVSASGEISTDSTIYVGGKYIRLATTRIQNTTGATYDCFVNLGTTSGIRCTGSGLDFSANTYYDGSNSRAINTGASAYSVTWTGGFEIWQAPSVTAGAVQTFTKSFSHTPTQTIINNIAGVGASAYSNFAAFGHKDFCFTGSNYGFLQLNNGYVNIAGVGIDVSAPNGNNVGINAGAYMILRGSSASYPGAKLELGADSGEQVSLRAFDRSSGNVWKPLYLAGSSIELSTVGDNRLSISNATTSARAIRVGNYSDIWRGYNGTYTTLCIRPDGQYATNSVLEVDVNASTVLLNAYNRETATWKAMDYQATQHRFTNSAASTFLEMGGTSSHYTNIVARNNQRNSWSGFSIESNTTYVTNFMCNGSNSGLFRNTNASGAGYWMILSDHSVTDISGNGAGYWRVGDTYAQYRSGTTAYGGFTSLLCWHSVGMDAPKMTVTGNGTGAGLNVVYSANIGGFDTYESSANSDITLPRGYNVVILTGTLTANRSLYLPEAYQGQMIFIICRGNTGNYVWQIKPASGSSETINTTTSYSLSGKTIGGGPRNITLIGEYQTGWEICGVYST